MENASNLHPGRWIRVEVIPNGMSVTEAARLLGVGRSALSNLLNGNAALSADMATRLEKTFACPRDLLQMQAKYDAAQAKLRKAPEDTKAYVPPFLGIKANQIEQWATQNIAARARFSVFVRMLVHSTGRALTKTDFPGNDDAERAGWDGFVEAGEGTPWVPADASGWEFGTNKDINAKATDDFAKSVRAIPKRERAHITFVFITPRRWFGKAAWVNGAKKKSGWKDVRAYDSSDLEQWLEQSLPAQAWFANETHLPAEGVRSLDQCWRDWANVSAAPLAGSLFASAIKSAKRTMLSRLSIPPEGPTVITADSNEEALAFLAQLFGEPGGALTSLRDRILVFDRPGVLPRLVQGAQTFIPVAYTREVERELGPYAASMRSIVVYPRNFANTERHIVLEPASHEAFNNALEEMGKNRDERSRLANESGRSLTVLRRRLAIVSAIKTPDWALDHGVAAALVPFLFVGTWNSENEADTSALSLLAKRPYTDLEQDCQRLAQVNDAPMWSIGAYRGVISKIDLLHAISSTVTPDALRAYFTLAQAVLGEDDPSLDLPENQRWAAVIHGKTRQFSRAFRDGVSETLVLLAVHGVRLFKQRVGIDTESEVIRLVRQLLPTPLTKRVLEANDDDLPTYAEAAPDQFLTILERDLKTDGSAALALLRPVTTGIMGHPSRTGLLWALEGLAWNPETLPRAALILARLATVEINDNWINKPIDSLQSIFRVWMPQTSLGTDERLAVMKMLARQFPEVAWKICIAQLREQFGIGSYSRKPRWRNDGHGFGEPVQTFQPINQFRVGMVDMVLSWRQHTVSTLSDVIDIIHRLDDEHQTSAWTLVEAWARDKASDADKAALQEKIRVAALSRRAAVRAKDNVRFAALAEKAKAAHAALQPQELLNKHAWLFRATWVEESADELEHIDTFDHEMHAQRIEHKRLDAMREVATHRGLDGLVDLATRGRTPWLIGYLATRKVLTEPELIDLLQLLLPQSMFNDTIGVASNTKLLGGILCGLADEDKLAPALMPLVTGLSAVDKGQLMVLAPFDKRTWTIVDALGDDSKAAYWKYVDADRGPKVNAELNEAIGRLMESKRPRAAFACIRFTPETLDAQVLFRLLSDMAKGGHDRNEEQFDVGDIERAFKYLSSSPVLTLEQKATLEFAFIDALSHRDVSELGSSPIPNLERYVEDHPEFFVQAIAWTYKRSDGGTDPAELQLPADRQAGMAARCHRMLETLTHIPGHDDLGNLTAQGLANWVTSVRESCGALGRDKFADLCLGRLLAHSAVGGDGVWPCEPVRQAMEEIQSEHVMSGAHMGVYNARGMHERGEGGDQERTLADKYREWGQALQFSHPYVSSQLLFSLARTYEHEATSEDISAGINRRLR